MTKVKNIFLKMRFFYGMDLNSLNKTGQVNVLISMWSHKQQLWSDPYPWSGRGARYYHLPIRPDFISKDGEARIKITNSEAGKRSANAVLIRKGEGPFMVMGEYSFTQSMLQTFILYSGMLATFTAVGCSFGFLFSSSMAILLAASYFILGSVLNSFINNNVPSGALEAIIHYFHIFIAMIIAGFGDFHSSEYLARGQILDAFDTAKILSAYGDGFMLRTDSDKKVENFAKYLSIPVINGLSPSSHPTQVLSDVFTVEEIKKKPISKLNICWIGDSNNVLDSLIAASVKFSFKLSIGCPRKFEPGKEVRTWVKRNNKQIYIYNDAKKAVSGADVIFSDKVISLNDKVNKKKKIQAFKNFKIDKKLMSYAKKSCIFLHCLPRGDEVSDDVFLGKKSHVWQQALNRVHVQKSILLYCFGKLR